MYTARSRLLEQHPRIGHLLMAMLSQPQVVLRLVIVDLVVRKEVGRLALVDRAPAVTVGTVAKNLSLGSRGAEEPAKNLRLSCGALSS